MIAANRPLSYIELKHEYEDLTGTDIPLCGYENLPALCRAIPDTIKVRTYHRIKKDSVCYAF